MHLTTDQIVKILYKPGELVNPYRVMIFMIEHEIIKTMYSTNQFKQIVWELVQLGYPLISLNEYTVNSSY